MKALYKRLETTLRESGDDRGQNFYLNAEEVTALVNSRRATCFNHNTALDRYIEDEGTSYYPGLGNITITRAQAKDLAEDFARFSEKDGEQLLARVYVSLWHNNKFYVSL